jgi:hypothetical protein
MPHRFRKLSLGDPTPDHDRPEVLLAALVVAVAVAHRRLGPSSSAITSTTDRALPFLGGPAPLLEPAHDHDPAALFTTNPCLVRMA